MRKIGDNELVVHTDEFLSSSYSDCHLWPVKYARDVTSRPEDAMAYLKVRLTVWSLSFRLAAFTFFPASPSLRSVHSSRLSESCTLS